MAYTYNYGEYAVLRREAQSRVSRMQESNKTSRQNQQQVNNRKNPRPAQPAVTVSNEVRNDKELNKPAPPKAPRMTSLIDIVMKDKERSLIILLILLLSQENGNQGIILSLMYLLM